MPVPLETDPFVLACRAKKRFLLNVGYVLLLVATIIVLPDLQSCVHLKVVRGLDGDDIHYLLESFMLRLGEYRIYEYEVFSHFYGTICPVKSAAEFQAYADYPPLAYLLYLPLSPLAPKHFIQACFLLNCVLLVISAGFLGACWVRLGNQALSWERILKPAITCLGFIVCYSPTIDNLMQGQLNIPIFCLLCCFAYAWMTGRETLAGVAVVAAGGLKIFPLLMLLPLVLRGKGRSLLVSLGSLVGVYAWIGWTYASTMQQYLTKVFPFYLTRQPVGLPCNRALDGLLVSLWGVQDISHLPEVCRRVLLLFKLLCLGLTVLVLYRVGRSVPNTSQAMLSGQEGLHPEEPDVARSRWVRSAEISLSVLLMYQLLPSSWGHYHEFLLIPFVLVFRLVLEHPLSDGEFLAAGLVVFVWFMVCSLEGLVSMPERAVVWWMRWYWYEGPWMAPLKTCLFGATLYLYDRIAVRFGFCGSGTESQETPRAPLTSAVPSV